MTSAPRAARWLVPVLLVFVWLGVGGVLGPYAGKLSEVATNDQSAFLPQSAESTRVLNQETDFRQDRTVPAVVVWTADDGRVSAAQRAAATRALESLTGTPYVEGTASPVVPSKDGEALSGVLQIRSDVSRHSTDVVERIEDRAGQVPGTTAFVGGPAATQADLTDAFSGIDTLLVGVAVAVVLLILLLVYRSVLLPLVIILGAVFALGLASGIVYYLAEHDLATVDGQVQGILSILVIGASTDYALLLAARFREELAAGTDRWPAIRSALRRSAGAIAASAATVALGLLALLLSDLSNNRALGPVGAIGIVCSLLSAVTFLPAVLLLLGRGAYWPARPRPERTPSAGSGLWSRIASLVDRRPRRIWATCLVVLAACAAFMPQLRAAGVPLSETFVGGAPSVTAQDVLDEHYPGGSGNPAVVLTDSGALRQVVRTAAGTDGVSGARPRTGGEPGQDGREPLVVDGRALVDVTLSAPADSDAARQTVRRLRDNLHGISGADALVGGYTAQQLDTQTTAQHDEKIIIPVVLGIILAILILLLRSVLLPLLLVATVGLNFAATLGVSGLVFQDLLGFTGTDSSVPLYGFVFLVALGVDYNIFLMTRVREESLRHGTRDGVLRGLRATGGVITSAGVVLAATFAALVVIPLAFLVQIAFIVAFGVLLDTLVVRSLLVPALVRDAGAVVWWPGALYRRRNTNESMRPGHGPGREPRQEE
jgi:RND superfamily putative drug exporter